MRARLTLTQEHEKIEKQQRRTVSGLKLRFLQFTEHVIELCEVLLQGTAW